MTNGYFNLDNPEARRTLARAESVNNTFQAVADGFGKLPTEDALKQGRVTYGADTGAANAYVVALPYAPTAYTLGLRVSMKVAHTNTGASTINVQGPSGLLGVKNIKRFNGSALVRNDLIAGAIIDMCYDGTDFVLVSQHGATETSALLAVEAKNAAEMARGLTESALADSLQARDAARLAAVQAEAIAGMPAPDGASDVGKILSINAAGTAFELSVPTNHIHNLNTGIL